MKKIIKLSLFLLVFASCKKTNISQDSTFEDFKKDQLLVQLHSNCLEIKLGTYSKQTQLPLIKDGLETARKIVTKYSMENSLKFVQMLKDENFGQQEEMRIFFGCSRNGDGTVNYGDCNIWEMIAVAVYSAFSCDSPEGGATPAEIEAFYDCVQGVVCKRC